jgi:hypothetical protein
MKDFSAERNCTSYCSECIHAKEMGDPNLYPDMFYCEYHKVFVKIDGGLYVKRPDTDGRTES